MLSSSEERDVASEACPREQESNENVTPTNIDAVRIKPFAFMPDL